VKNRLSLVLVLTALAGCDGSGDLSDPAATRVATLTGTIAPAADTFINSFAPDNNNGTSPSIFTGMNGQGGMMRGLVRFAIPTALQGHITVGRVSLTMVTRALGMTNSPPTAATESLQPLAVDWTEGAGFGDSAQQNTVGEACGTTGATWNQPNCAGGTDWAGGAVAGAVSATASVPAALETTVSWDSMDAGNAALVADVQSWSDTPAGNHGWRITSSTETSTGAQRFYSREVTGKGPSLAITYACKAGDTCGAETDAGGTGTGGGAGSGTGGGGGTGAGSGGGCSCALAGATGRPLAVVYLLAIAALGLARRRQRTR